MRILAASVLLLGPAFALPAAPASREVSRTVPLETDGRVTIDTRKGSVEVTGWDQPRVEIVARIEGDDGFLRDNPGECVERTEIGIDSWPRSLRIRSDYRGIESGESGGFLGWLLQPCASLPLVHYRIRMPRTAELRIRDQRSRIELEDLHGGARIDTYGGTLEARRLTGRLDVETYRGEADVDLADVSTSRFETYRGEIDIHLPRDSHFDLAAEIGQRGNLRSAFEPGTRAVNGGGPLLRLKTERGTIRLRTN